jgi:hypothetical protein
MFRIVALVSLGLAGSVFAADPFADRVVSYIAGEGVGVGYDDPNSAIGSPTRVNFFGDSVTPFNTPYWGTDVVTIGRGGSLVVAFDEAILDNPLNPYGIDLLVFGNQFFITDSAGRVNGLFGEGGFIELSADGENWVAVTGLTAEGGFPTLGFVGIADLQFGGDQGTGPTDFTRPVDPTLNWIGMTREELAAAYEGSGGGLGIDIGAVGLSSVTHVRISNSSDAVGTPEIDGFAAVTPVPAPAAMAMLALCFARPRSRRGT